MGKVKDHFKYLWSWFLQQLQLWNKFWNFSWVREKWRRLVLQKHQVSPSKLWEFNSPCPLVKVINSHSSTKFQLEMCVRINPTRNHKFSTSIDDSAATRYNKGRIIPNVLYYPIFYVNVGVLNAVVVHDLSTLDEQAVLGTLE